MIVIVEYGMGNVGSIANMLGKTGAECRLSSDPKEILAADKLVLPGVGAFDHGMANLRQRDLIGPLEEAVLERGKPVIGICLGMQLLSGGSEEGSLPGLGWLPARTIRFQLPPPAAGADPRSRLRIPHMGWNEIRPRAGSRLMPAPDDGSRFYFVHSYHVVCDSAEHVSSTAHYGVEFTASVEKGNIFGVQFHPEKSHRHGMALFRRFLEV
jgi:glutamine amidotransferase